MKNRLLIIAAACLLAFAPAPGAAQSVTPADLSEDLRDWRQWMFATHPDPQHTMDATEVEAAFDQTANPDRASYTQREAWLSLAQLNNMFRDAHVGLRLPDQAYAKALQRGAKPFSEAVTVTDGRIFLADDPDTEIVAINQIPAADITATLTPRMRGESRRLQERVLSLRFPVAVWVMLGDQSDYALSLRSADGTSTIRELGGASSAPAANPKDFDLAFDGATAIITVNTFDREHEDAFAAFLKSAFAEISARDSKRLLIDLRSNGGGARELSDRLMAYLTMEKYTPISAVSARITADNQSLIPGSKVGEVVHTPYAQWVTPPAELDHRFSGEMALLIGPETYSQAIAFAVTAQDFKIATLLGAPTEGLANGLVAQAHTQDHFGRCVTLDELGHNAGLTW